MTARILSELSLHHSYYRFSYRIFARVQCLQAWVCSLFNHGVPIFNSVTWNHSSKNSRRRKCIVIACFIQNLLKRKVISGLTTKLSVGQVTVTVLSGRLVWYWDGFGTRIVLALD